MSSGELTMTLTGDLMLGGEFSRRYAELRDCIIPDDARSLFDADVVFANLECPCSNRGKPIVGKNLHHCYPEALDALGRLNVNVVSLANNHILDYGMEAARDTIDAVAARGICCGGVGSHIEEASDAVVVDTGNGPVAWLFFSWTDQWIDSVPGATKSSPGVNPWQIAAAVRQVQAARSRFKPRLICVSVHWGEGLSCHPRPDSVAEARTLVDAGADVIVGHHSHCLQTGELYRGKLILYSLGNLICSPFYRARNRRLTYAANEGLYRSVRRRERRTVVARVTMSRHGEMELDLVPFVQNQTLPILEEPTAKTRTSILDGWRRRAKRLGNQNYARSYGGYRRVDEVRKYCEEFAEGGWSQISFRTPFRLTRKLVTGRNLH